MRLPLTSLRTPRVKAIWRSKMRSKKITLFSQEEDEQLSESQRCKSNKSVKQIKVKSTITTKFDVSEKCFR